MGLGSPRQRGGAFTTNAFGQIQADVRLVMGGATVASGRTTGADGLVVLTTTGLSGACEFVVEPDNFAQSAPAGTNLSGTRQQNSLLYRNFSVSGTLTDGELTAVTDPYDPPAQATVARVGNRREFGPTRDELPLSIKPDWWASGSGSARSAGANVDLLVIHCTSGARLGNALNHWFSRNGGPHYALDIDGHLIKMEEDERRLSHLKSNYDVWERHILDRSNNDRSICIEVINPHAKGPYSFAYLASDAEQPYTNEQYVALVRVCGELLVKFPGIEHRIIGHSDVACGKPPAGTGRTELGSRKRYDPGNRFEWERLEAAGLGMVSAAEGEATIYGGVFGTFAGLSLQAGDRDHDATRRRDAILGHTRRPGFAGTPVKEIKDDLRTIGYSLGTGTLDGDFDDLTVGAVDRFKRHFFSGTRGKATGGTVDAATAAVIRGVRLAYFPI